MSKMTNKLADASPAPDPIRKDHFIRTYRSKAGAANLSMRSLILSQINYISAPVWVTTLAVLFLVLYAVHTDQDIIFLTASLTPFVSGIAIFDSFRSQFYSMTEMESASLFSLRGIFFAKMICIGIVHIFFILMLSLIISPHTRFSYIKTGIIITMPYLLSSIICLKAERSILGRKNPFICLGISALISALVFFTKAISKRITYTLPEFWFILFITLAVLAGNEIRKTLKWEEYLWN